ncbi:MAG: hypothetical protein K2N38_10875, partial [Oscillospiraceae bacterium]|nr:hypothetical protein [Oscillospiraceae bacterium]
VILTRISQTSETPSDARTNARCAGNLGPAASLYCRRAADDADEGLSTVCNSPESSGLLSLLFFGFFIP